MKLNQKLSFYLILSILIFNVGCSSDEPDPPEDNPPNLNQNFSVTSSDGQAWSTSSLTLYDQAYSFVSLISESTQGARVEINSNFYSGLGTYNFEQTAGAWSYIPDNQTGTIYSNVFFDEGDFGTITFTEHNQQTNKLSGSFDFTLPNVVNADDSVSVQGTFTDVPLEPVNPTDGQVSLEMNDEEFVPDYMQTVQFSNDIIIVLTQDIQNMAFIEFDRFGVQDSTTYNMALSAPVGLEFRDPSETFNDEVTGTFTITTHEPGSVINGIPGYTAGHFQVFVGNQEGTLYKNMVGNFSVNYE